MWEVDRQTRTVCDGRYSWRHVTLNLDNLDRDVSFPEFVLVSHSGVGHGLLTLTSTWPNHLNHGVAPSVTHFHHPHPHVAADGDDDVSSSLHPSDLHLDLHP